MDIKSAVTSLSALAHSTRLKAFQLLVRYEPGGLPAGDVARQLGVPQSTMSVHLATLTRAGLIRAERRNREKIYRADCDQVMALNLFLVEDCCGYRAELNLTAQKDFSI